MNQLTIETKALHGTLTVQPSKYLAHRLIIAAALAEGHSTLSPVYPGDDVLATSRAVETMGIARCKWQDETLLIDGGQPAHTGKRIDCNESGSTLRFLLPMPAIWGVEALFCGKDSLLQRPMHPYSEIFARQGITYQQEPTHIRVSGQLHPGLFELPGDVSSQFVTGLLFALPLLDGDSTLSLSSELESRGYADMTLDVLDQFGVSAFWENSRTLEIPGNQHYKPAQTTVSGDWAHAAFYLAAGVMGSSELKLQGLDPALKQDSQIAPILQSMGGDIQWDGKTLVARGSKLHGISVDGRNIPDLIPILAVAACAAEGETRIENVGRLRFKESNRLEGLAEQLCRLGGSVRVDGDNLLVSGRGELRGGRVDALGDHRLAMSLAMASILCTEPVLLSGARSVAKSAPQFWQEYAELGGVAFG